jgi:hypothetical protein
MELSITSLPVSIRDGGLVCRMREKLLTFSWGFSCCWPVRRIHPFCPGRHWKQLPEVCVLPGVVSTLESRHDLCFYVIPGSWLLGWGRWALFVTGPPHKTLLVLPREADQTAHQGLHRFMFCNSYVLGIRVIVSLGHYWRTQGHLQFFTATWILLSVYFVLLTDYTWYDVGKYMNITGLNTDTYSTWIPHTHAYIYAGPSPQLFV